MEDGGLRRRMEVEEEEEEEEEEEKDGALESGSRTKNTMQSL